MITTFTLVSTWVPPGVGSLSECEKVGASSATLGSDLSDCTNSVYASASNV